MTLVGRGPPLFLLFAPKIHSSSDSCVSLARVPPVSESCASARRASASQNLSKCPPSDSFFVVDNGDFEMRKTWVRMSDLPTAISNAASSRSLPSLNLTVLACQRRF